MYVRKSSSIENKEKLMNSFYKEQLSLKINKYLPELESIINEANSDILFNVYFWKECISVVEINKSYCKILKTEVTYLWLRKSNSLKPSFVMPTSP